MKAYLPETTQLRISGSWRENEFSSLAYRYLNYYYHNIIATNLNLRIKKGGLIPHSYTVFLFRMTASTDR